MGEIICNISIYIYIHIYIYIYDPLDFWSRVYYCNFIILKTSSRFVISISKFSPSELGTLQVFSYDSRICCRDTSLGWNDQCKNILFLFCFISTCFQLRLYLNSNISTALVNIIFNVSGLWPRASNPLYRSLAVKIKSFF